MIKTLEKDVLASICEYLALKRYFFWRSNTTPIYDPTRKTFRSMPAFSLKGVPDIIVVIEGKFVGIEVKTKVGIQSDYQKDFERRLTACGGKYILARSIEDVMNKGL